MPKPNYPDDAGRTLNRINSRAREAWTAAQSRTRYAVIRAASIIVGAATGNRITIQPDVQGTTPRIEVQTSQGVMSLLAVGDTIALVTGIDPGADDVTYVGISSDGVAEMAAYSAGSRIGSVRMSDEWVRLEHTTHGAVLIDGVVGAQLKKYGPSGPTITDMTCTDDLAFMRARDSSGDLAALLSLGTDGRIQHFGTWDPPL